MLGLSREATFWWRTSFILCAMATYKAATGFTALVIPLVLEKMPPIDRDDEVMFNFWVSVQILVLYVGEALGELLTGVLTDKYPLLLKKMLLVVLVLAGLSFLGQGLVVWLLLQEPLTVSMSAMTVMRFLNGFFSPAVQGSLASFQLVERELAWGAPQKNGDLRSKVENMRPVALYLGDIVGCIFIGFAAFLDLHYSFFILAISNLLMFLCILVGIPDPIFDGMPELTTAQPNVQDDFGDREPLLNKDGQNGDPEPEAKPITGPNWWLFKYYVWNRAVIFIFLANMMNSLFNSIVGSDQIILLDMSELLLALENLLGSLFGVALAWYFMTYLFKRLGSIKSLHLTGILSAISLGGMPWMILSIPLSVMISIVYTPVIITQDAVAIISGASFAVKTIENSEGFAYGFLNSISMAACGLAPFVYTLLLSLFPKLVVWLILSATYILLIAAEVANLLRRRCSPRSKVTESENGKPTEQGPVDEPQDHGDLSDAVISKMRRERSKSHSGSFSQAVPQIVIEGDVADDGGYNSLATSATSRSTGRQKSASFSHRKTTSAIARSVTSSGDKTARSRGLSVMSHSKLAIAAVMIGNNDGNALPAFIN